MKHTLFAIAVATSLLSACNITIEEDKTNKIKNGKTSSSTNEQSYDYSNFDKIEIASSIDLNLTQDSTFSVRLEGSSDEIEQTKIVLQNGKLSISKKDGNSFFDNYNPTVHISMPKVSLIATSGSSDVSTKNHFTQNIPMSLHYSGSSDMDMQITAPAVSVAGAGSGDIVLKGTTSKMDIALSGSGDVDALLLLADTVTISVAGSGDVTTHATKVLNVSATGTTDVRYRGNPTINKQAIGMAEISKYD